MSLYLCCLFTVWNYKENLALTTPGKFGTEQSLGGTILTSLTVFQGGMYLCCLDFAGDRKATGYILS